MVACQVTGSVSGADDSCPTKADDVSVPQSFTTNYSYACLI